MCLSVNASGLSLVFVCLFVCPYMYACLSFVCVCLSAPQCNVSVRRACLSVSVRISVRRVCLSVSVRVSVRRVCLSISVPVSVRRVCLCACVCPACFSVVCLSVQVYVWPLVQCVFVCESLCLSVLFYCIAVNKSSLKMLK